ncbi:MAG: ABC-2 family transporter protein [Planctomycetaceae bacterium]|nr:ABC-2 family transporter protein [Planctomycetaceae bacterium]
MFADAFRVQSCILRTSISERLVYRADFAFATLVRFLPIVTQVFLWGAIYGGLNPGQSKTINGYTYGDMVAYSLLVMLGRAFSSMPGLTTGIARDIRDGSIKKFLTQPIDLLDYLLWHRVAHKLVYYTVAAGPFAIVFWLCRAYFPGWPTATTLLAGTVALAMSFLIGFLIEALLGLIAFWYLEVSSLIFVYMLLNYFLSGHMLPLDWLPRPYSDFVLWLPFKYLAYVPAAILLGRYTPTQLWQELALEAAWIVVLWLICRWTLNRGWRQYSAYGG